MNNKQLANAGHRVLSEEMIIAINLQILKELLTVEAKRLMEDQHLSNIQKNRILGRLRKAQQQHWTSNAPFRSPQKELANWDRQREQRRRIARAIHLSRAFLNETPYRVVENTVRPGNEPNVHDMLRVMHQDMDELPSIIEEWIKA